MMNNMEITEETDEEEIWERDCERLKGKTLIGSINIRDKFQNKIGYERLNNIFSRLGYKLYSNCISREKSRREQNYTNKIKTPKGGIAAIILENSKLINVVPDLNYRCLKVIIKINNENICIFGAYAPSACEPIEIRRNSVPHTKFYFY